MNAKLAPNILALSRRQKEILRMRIKRWSGLVRIFVHPLYEKWHWSPDQYATDEKTKRPNEIERFLSKLLAMPETMTPPILIMEEEYRLPRLHRWLEGNSEKGQNPLFIPTLQNNPCPAIPSLPYWQSEKAWTGFILSLQKLGVRKIVMAGMQFETNEYKKDWTGKGPWVAGCVGIAMSYLSRDKAGSFDLRLSALIDSSEERQRYLMFLKSRN